MEKIQIPTDVKPVICDVCGKSIPFPNPTYYASAKNYALAVKTFISTKKRHQECKDVIGAKKRKDKKKEYLQKLYKKMRTLDDDTVIELLYELTHNKVRDEHIITVTQHY